MRGDVGAFERGRVKIVEIVNDRHAPDFFGKKLFDQMRTDKTRTAGDQDIFLIFHKIWKDYGKPVLTKIPCRKSVWQKIQFRNFCRE
jgi:hypothetical protein